MSTVKNAPVKKGTATTKKAVHADSKNESKNTKKTTAEVVKKAKETTVWAEKMAVIKANQEAEAKLKAEQKAKEQAEKKRPGVIVSILDFIKSSKKPVTQAQVLAHLEVEFPKRETKSMTNTIKAQIGGKKRPMRMEREKQVIFDVVENKAGVKSYSIAHIEEVVEVETQTQTSK